MSEGFSMSCSCGPELGRSSFASALRPYGCGEMSTWRDYDCKVHLFVSLFGNVKHDLS